MLSRRLPGAIALLAGLLGGATSLSAQDATGTPVEYARRLTIASTVLGERRTIDVTLPASYGSAPERRYPVLVVLDGESQHLLAAALASYYASIGQLPEMIVAGVANTARERDLTPPLAQGFSPPPGPAGQVGSGDRFLRFLGDELLPRLDRDYRTAPMRVLAGHSLGGEFVLYALATRPELFTGYVVMDPAVWWNRGRELEGAAAALRRPALRRARVMLVRTPSLGADTTRWGGDAPMVRHFDTPGETHTGMPPAALMQALRAMFADFLPTPWRPGTRPIAMLARLDSLTERVGYAVPVPAQTYDLVTRMSLDARYFDDAERVLGQWERAWGASDESRAYRTRLARERTTPAPATFVPLEFPANRPTARAAQAFLGRWVQVGRERGSLDLELRSSGDTVTAHATETFQDGGQPFESTWYPIRLAPDGAFEVGAPVFRGLAALLVYRFRLVGTDTLEATREARGVVPRGGGPELFGGVRFRRVGE